MDSYILPVCFVICLLLSHFDNVSNNEHLRPDVGPDPSIDLRSIINCPQLDNSGINTRKLAPGGSATPMKEHRSAFPLQDLYTRCLGQTSCSVSTQLIMKTLDELGHNIITGNIIICIQGDYFHEVHMDDNVLPSDVGFIIGTPSKSDIPGPNITISVQNNTGVAIDVYFMYNIQNGTDVRIHISGGDNVHCGSFGQSERQLWLWAAQGIVNISFTSCYSAGRFGIRYVNFLRNFSSNGLPYGWQFRPNEYHRVWGDEDCKDRPRCPTTGTIIRPTPMPTPTTDKSMSVVALGGLISGGIIVFLLLLLILVIWWRRKRQFKGRKQRAMQALPVQLPPVDGTTSELTRQADPSPEDTGYTEMYHYRRGRPSLQYKAEGPAGNLYAVVHKERHGPVTVSTHSLTIEGNESYLTVLEGNGQHEESKGQRDSAGVFIVENDVYDSLANGT